MESGAPFGARRVSSVAWSRRRVAGGSGGLLRLLRVDDVGPSAAPIPLAARAAAAAQE